MMFVGAQQPREQKELSTRERKGQDTTKITSNPAESCIQLISLVSDADFDEGAHVDGEKHSQSKHRRGFH